MEEGPNVFYGIFSRNFLVLEIMRNITDIYLWYFPQCLCKTYGHPDPQYYITISSSFVSTHDLDLVSRAAPV